MIYGFGGRIDNDSNAITMIDFESGENEVTMITETDGTPVTTVGAITWDDGE